MGRNNQQRRAAKAKQRQTRARSGAARTESRYGSAGAPPASAPGSSTSGGAGASATTGASPTGGTSSDEHRSPRQQFEQRMAERPVPGQPRSRRTPEQPADEQPTPEEPSDEQQFEHWLAEAVGGLEQGSNRALLTAYFAMVDLVTPGSYASRRLAGLLGDQVRLAWRRGWQPADVNRVAERRLTGHASALIRDAMLTDLESFARASVHPRWFGQLDDIEATRWWPESMGYLDANLVEAEGDEHVVIDSVLRASQMLRRLPTLAPIGPMPGEYREQPRRASRESVDERMLTRVRRMLAKAESTEFEAEAEAFTEAAQRLMARHSIDMAMLAESDATARDGTEAVRIGVDRPYEKQKAVLLTAVAQANRCRTVWSKDLGFSTVVGFPADLRATETLFTSLLVQSVRAMAGHGSRRTAHGSRTRSFRSSFLEAFANRIGERLAEITREQTAEAERVGSPGASRELVLVLADRSAEVQEATERLFPETKAMKVSGSVDAEGWHAGRRAADMAQIGAGAAVTSSGDAQEAGETPDGTLF